MTSDGADAGEGGCIGRDEGMDGGEGVDAGRQGIFLLLEFLAQACSQALSASATVL